MKSATKFFAASILVVAVCFLMIQCTDTQKSSEPKEMSHDDMVAHGKYLVTIASCNDCHSPKIFTQMGPMPDTTKLLSGSSASGMPPLAIDTNCLHNGYGYLGSADLTAWLGPWGISYTANLTPDSATGIGAWTEANFMDALRKGKHLGMDGGRMILPPMPWQFIGQMTDDDLKAVFAYLRSLPAISNKVPAPVSPPDVMAMAMKK
ncbi:MAG TPA: c-type cytochrome [Chitinophagales bacterium]|nr:c-type cytochrome [Chitinophagales bacterium]